MGQETYVEKIKINFEGNLLILLTNGNKLPIFKNKKLIKTIELAKKCDAGHKYLFINDENIFKNLHLPNKSIDKTLVLFDLLNFDLVNVNMAKLENIQSTTQKLIDRNDSYLNNLVIVHRELNLIFFIEKSLQKFTFVSYEKKLVRNSRESSTIRYLNYRDEKVTQKFWSTFVDYPNFKYKVLKIKNQEFYFSISILKRENENDSKSLIKKVHSTLIVYARIVKSSNRKDNSIEIEIVQVYPFCKRFHFFENETNPNEVILCAYLTNHLISDYVSNDGKLSMINISTNKELFNLDLNTISNPKIKNLCVDSNMEYIVFNDRNKLLWLFRVRDQKQLGCLPLYGFVKEIKFNKDNRYVCLNMNDRRIFNLLIVDPDCESHKNRIKELNSRKICDASSINQGTNDKTSKFLTKEKTDESNEKNKLEAEFETLADNSSYSSDNVDGLFSSDDDDDNNSTSINQKESNII